MSEVRLKYLKHSEIDYLKWDRCIMEAPNSRVYAASWFLDRTAVVWDALVWGDYEFVMPLPFRKKFGISYLYQPLFCQQLGIYPSPNEEIAGEFYAAAVSYFSYSEMQLNASNLPLNNAGKVQFAARKNFLLPLDTGYEAIVSGYSKNTRRNIAKAGNHRLGFIEGIQMERYLRFKQDNRIVKLSGSGCQKLKSIIAYSQYLGLGEIAGVYSPENELCAAVFFCRWKDRLIYMNATSSKEGKEMRAMFFLLSHIVEASAGKNLTLDFEGSMIPGVARFFEGFGAAPETYYRMVFNRLPFLVNLLKNLKA